MWQAGKLLPYNGACTRAIGTMGKKLDTVTV